MSLVHQVKVKLNFLIACERNYLGVYTSTKINDKSNLIFGFLGESQAGIYAQVNGYKGIAMKMDETSFVDTDFVAKHQESEVSILGSELANEERKFPFAISNDLNVDIAIKVIIN